MEATTNIELRHGDYILARITKCRVFGPGKTFTGIEFTFNLQVEPTSKITEQNPRLDRLVVDLYLIQNSAELYLGQLKDRFISSSPINYPRDHQQFLQLDTN